MQESVVFGSQIYACTVQLDGSFAFTQNNVEARLTGGIHHTFVQPAAGDSGSSISLPSPADGAGIAAGLALLIMGAGFTAARSRRPPEQPA